jgi:hypothetical protein
MPKPVLSDSLFNADDVATAVLAEANLQVTNSDLGVVDRESIFVVQSGFSLGRKQMFSFNGFMFIMGLGSHPNGTPTNGETIIQISDSDFYPSQPYAMPLTGHQADASEGLILNTNGSIEVHNPVNVGANHYYFGFNGWYRFA